MIIVTLMQFCCFFLTLISVQDEPRILEKPIVVQSVGTDGQRFQFLVLQLNTTDLDPSQGVKNLVWIDGEQHLYEDARSRPEIKKKVVTVRWGDMTYLSRLLQMEYDFYSCIAAGN